ncbi:MAG TPA: CHAD domain-containing protein [Chitinophagaceae bacterium]
MKKNEIKEVITSHFKKIDKLFHEIIIGFEIEDIHKFRTQIKKLRAFLHLLNMEVEEVLKIKITKKMKTFYGYIGIIRNLQLHLKNINSYFENSTDKIPKAYTATIEKEIEYWKENTKEVIDFHNNFYNDEEKITSELPDKLRKQSIKKFIQYMVYELHNKLIRLNDDETLHSIRKLLKDILYNWTYVQPYIAPLSPGLSQEEEIGSFIEMLGVFCDKCMGLTLIQKYNNDSAEDEEKIVLEEIIHTWSTEKQELKEIICSKLELLPIKPMIASSFSYKNWF